MHVSTRTLALALAGAAVVPGRARAEEPRRPQGFDRARPYLAVTPGILTVELKRGTSQTAYLWGVDGGYHFSLGRFKVQPGLLFEHSPIRGEWSTAHWFRLGPQVRVGGGGRRMFGYGTLGLMLDLFHSEGHDGGTFPTGHSFAGAGLQGCVRDRLLLGGEVVVDAIVLSDLFLRARVFVGVLF